MSLEHNKRLARLYFETIQTGNLDVFDEIMADDFTVQAIHGKYSVVINPSGDDEGGPAAFKKFAVEWRETYPDGQVTLDEIVAEDDRVIVWWTFTGTQRGTFLGIPPTHKRVTWAGFNSFRIEHGKLAEAWDMMDRLSLWQQLGVLPPTKEFLEQAQQQRNE
jgi:steroid delta-isomerase-like uncharacterized protein